VTEDYQVFWGETHHNTHQRAVVTTPFAEIVKRARGHLDFFAAAYYTATATAFKGAGHAFEQGASELIFEGWKPQDRLESEWAEVEETAREANDPGAFVTFPGYEWQGDGSSGDHNVIAFDEGLPLFHVDTIAELYECLRGRRVIAIPHHTAYRAGVRGRVWDVVDEDLSPFTEIFSIHGSSETDEELVGLRRNPHMGPGVAGGTWQDALDRGFHIGVVASTDGWGEMPGVFGRGLAAVLATDLTREALWDAFTNRRVYAVTGDRIILDFRINGAPMGSITKSTGPRKVEVSVTCSDALDRIELLRNGRVITTHCHQGTWEPVRPGRRTCVKVRVEAGWGPGMGEVNARPKRFEGRIEVDGGRVVGWEPCWVSPGQERARVSGGRADFALLSEPESVAGRWQNANVFEIETDASSEMRLSVNGLAETGAVADFAAGSREMWFRDECVAMLAERAGVVRESPERGDIYHHVAYKVKVHRAMPEAAYTARFEFEDDAPLDGEANYRIRVEERNGQRAWSSPIWVTPV
jgi:hypothetical protein